MGSRKIFDGSWIEKGRLLIGVIALLGRSQGIVRAKGECDGCVGRMSAEGGACVFFRCLIEISLYSCYICSHNYED